MPLRADPFRQGDICLIRPRPRVPIDATAHIGADPPFPAAAARVGVVVCTCICGEASHFGSALQRRNAAGATQADIGVPSPCGRLAAKNARTAPAARHGGSAQRFQRRNAAGETLPRRLLFPPRWRGGYRWPRRFRRRGGSAARERLCAANHPRGTFASGTTTAPFLDASSPLSPVRPPHHPLSSSR